MNVTVGINTFGRVDHYTLVNIAETGRNDIQVIKLNATGPIETTAHLLRYDSVHSRFAGNVALNDNSTDLGRSPIEVTSKFDPSELDWTRFDVLLKCTSKFNGGKTSVVHNQQGATAVLISTVSKTVDKPIVYAANHSDLIPSDTTISNGSYTTNCLAPLAKVLNDAIGIKSGIITTIHSYAGDQPTLDPRHKDLYRAGAAAMAMIPTSTVAAKALGEVLPE